MRKAIISITLAAVLTAVALFSGCEVTGPGGIVTKGEEVVTEEKDFTGFTYVDIEGTFKGEIIEADSFSTTVSADESFFDYVAVSKEGKTLRIYLNPRHTFTDFTLQAKTLKAKITMPALYGLRLSGASKATVTGFKSSKDFSLNVSGASSLDIVDCEMDDVECEVSGASEVTGNINADDVECEISGASKVELEGSANTIILKASGASKVNLDDFPLDNANIHLSGASEATVNVKGRLDCAVTAASRLYFQGNPTMGNVSVTGASTIKHR